MTLALLGIIIGFIVLAFGADKLVDGACALAQNHGVSPLMIGLTIIALGTSAPEIVVSIIASVKGNPGLAVGNALGSNIANIGLVLGLSALIQPLQIKSDLLRREYPILFAIMLLVFVLFIDLYLGLVDGLILAGGFGFLFVWMLRVGMQTQPQDVIEKEFQEKLATTMTDRRALVLVIVGCISLPAASYLLVESAIVIATYFGVSDLVIGVTIIAIGTSLPEVAASIAATIKKQPDIVVGNVLGSNMFNLLAVLPFAGLLHPSDYELAVLTRDIVFMFITAIILFLFVSNWVGKPVVTRNKGIILLGTYVCYLVIVYYGSLL